MQTNSPQRQVLKKARHRARRSQAFNRWRHLFSCTRSMPPDTCSPLAHIRTSAFHAYPNVCIPRKSEYLYSTHTLMSVFHAYPNICIPCIFEYLHSTHTRMSSFQAYPNVCIARIPEYLHSTYTRMSSFHAKATPRFIVLKVSRSLEIRTYSQQIDRFWSQAFYCYWKPLPFNSAG